MAEQPHFPAENASGAEEFNDSTPIPEKTGDPRPGAHAPADAWDEDRFFSRLGLGREEIAACRRSAHRNRTSVEAEVVAAGHAGEDQLYRMLAGWLHLPFLSVIAAEQVVDVNGLDTQLRRPLSVRLNRPGPSAIIAAAPAFSRLPALCATLARNERARDDPARARLAITTPSAIRAAVWERGSRRRVKATVAGLFNFAPQHSARFTLSAAQGFFAGAVLMILLAAVVIWPWTMLVMLHLLLSLIYFFTLMLRLAALSVHRSPVAEAAPERQEAGLPVYTVLVALYREGPMVAQLVEAMRQLDWPSSLLDIKFVCEAGDRDTIDCLLRQPLPPHMEVVVTPDMSPRTKPKALTYALHGARGELVTIYDAEDRPHPGQLREAHRRFSTSGPELGCLQAPLKVVNAAENWLTDLFALEYAALFGSFLPFLAKHDLPLPLGGTSNHFRKAALLHAGAWDPYNVTEDADLGLRLYRLGYRAGSICLPTREEAPAERAVWRAQRSRWFKGWIQTILVSLRHPLVLAAELGAAALLVHLVTCSGLVISALFHPLLIASLISHGLRLLLADAAPASLLEGVLTAMDLFNLIVGYAFFLLAGLLPHEGWSGFRWRQITMVPAYWLLLTTAAWMAVVELYRQPHAWNKTPHRPVRDEDSDSPA